MGDVSSGGSFRSKMEMANVNRVNTDGVPSSMKSTSKLYDRGPVSKLSTELGDSSPVTAFTLNAGPLAYVLWLLPWIVNVMVSPSWSNGTNVCCTPNSTSGHL